MTADIIGFPGDTTLDIDPDQVLRAAVGRYPKGVLLLGWNADGELCYASSIADVREMNWMLDLAKRDILEAYGE